MPEPKRSKGESDSEYRSRVVEHYVEKGRPQKQAVAIAYSRVPDKSPTKARKHR